MKGLFGRLLDHAGPRLRANVLYAHYLARHKWYVFVACRQLGVSLPRAILHDWHKMLPDEWHFYREKFYGYFDQTLEGLSSDEQARLLDAWDQAVDSGFAHAWNRHQKRARHHWQHYVLLEDDGAVKLLPIPRKYVLEMLADWLSVGRVKRLQREGRSGMLAAWRNGDRHRATRGSTRSATSEGSGGSRPPEEPEPVTSSLPHPTPMAILAAAYTMARVAAGASRFINWLRVRSLVRRRRARRSTTATAILRGTARATSSTSRTPATSSTASARTGGLRSGMRARRTATPSSPRATSRPSASALGEASLTLLSLGITLWLGRRSARPSPATVGEGAGKAITGRDDVVEWYLKTRRHRLLHPHAQQAIELILGVPATVQQARRVVEVHAHDPEVLHGMEFRGEPDRRAYHDTSGVELPPEGMYRCDECGELAFEGFPCEHPDRGYANVDDTTWYPWRLQQRQPPPDDGTMP